MSVCQHRLAQGVEKILLYARTRLRAGALQGVERCGVERGVECLSAPMSTVRFGSPAAHSHKTVRTHTCMHACTRPVRM